MNQVSALQTYFFDIYFNIILSYMSGSSKIFSFGYPIKILHKFLPSLENEACLSHPIFLVVIRTTIGAAVAAAATTKTTTTTNNRL